MEGYIITWKEKGKPHHTVILNKKDVAKVKRNIKELFGGTNIRARYFKETYAQVKKRERLMGIK